MSFIVTQDETKETITDTLGITNERAMELYSIVTEAWTKEDKVTGVMAAASKDCNSINELALAMMMIGQVEREFRLRYRGMI